MANLALRTTVLSVQSTAHGLLGLKLKRGFMLKIDSFHCDRTSKVYLILCRNIDIAHNTVNVLENQLTNYEQNNQTTRLLSNEKHNKLRYLITFMQRN